MYGYEMQVLTDGGWRSIKPVMVTEGTVSPFRYESQKDAELMLERLHPKLSKDKKRVVPAKAVIHG